MKKSTAIALTLIAAMGAASAAQASVAYCVSINSARLTKEIAYANKYGNTAKAAALEEALANIESSCTAKELKDAQSKVTKLQKKVVKAQSELAEAQSDLAKAQAQGRADKIAKYTRKVAEKQAKVESVTSELQEAQAELASLTS